MTAPVFISHSSKDRKTARKICSELENRGVNCWVADRDVGPGENFQEAIVRAIRAAKVMVLVFTENANHSTEIKKELALASRYGLVIIPARVEDAVPSEAFDYEFATRQWINLFEDWKTEMERLVVRVTHDSLKGSDSSTMSQPPSKSSAPLASLLRPIEPAASPSAPPQKQPQSLSTSLGASIGNRPADNHGPDHALPKPVRAVAWLLIVQSITRFGFWLDLLPGINLTDYVRNFSSLPTLALATGALAAGVLILWRSGKARFFAMVTNAICLLFQIYFFSNVLSTYLTGRVSSALLTFAVWVLQPAYLLTFAVAVLVLYRWRPVRS
jgi:hypothetical protein